MNTRWFVSFRKLGMRLVACGMILLFLLMTTAPASVQATSPRMLTGDTYFYVSDWGGVEIWMNYSIHEQAPDIGAAKGKITITVHDPWIPGWKSLVYVPECVKFAENTVTIVVEITKKNGVGNGEVGEHAKWQFYDGGAPGHTKDSTKDSFTIINYQLDPWIEYWPVGIEAPTCDSFDPVPGWEVPVYVTDGNLTIH
jgi:hypothetical protein